MSTEVKNSRSVIYIILGAAILWGGLNLFGDSQFWKNHGFPFWHWFLLSLSGMLLIVPGLLLITRGLMMRSKART